MTKIIGIKTLEKIIEKIKISGEWYYEPEDLSFRKGSGGFSAHGIHHCIHFSDEDGVIGVAFDSTTADGTILHSVGYFDKQAGRWSEVDGNLFENLHKAASCKDMSEK